MVVEVLSLKNFVELVLLLLMGTVNITMSVKSVNPHTTLCCLGGGVLGHWFGH